MTKTSITVIHCWSAPRSRSTALLYTFEARGEDDCVAMDEPLYREWLMSRGDLVSRPYLDALIKGEPLPDGDDSSEELERWKRELKPLNERIRDAATKLAATCTEGVIFCKQIAKFYPLYNFQEECQSPDINKIQLTHKHVLLIRDPVAVLSSWGRSSDVHGNNVFPDEVGCVPLLSIYSALKSCYNHSDTVTCIDADELVGDPKGTLQRLCKQLSIPFKESMLSWKSGPHACDGPWAKWWYANVHKSTGWKQETAEYYPETDSSSSSKYRQLDPHFIPTLKVSYPAYQYLYQLTFRYKTRGSPLYEDPRNANLLVWIGAPKTCGGGRLVPREFAALSPWDSSVYGGDACWEEGIRVCRGKIFGLENHLQRLHRSAKALGFQNNKNNDVHTKEEITDAIFRTLAANGMRDNAHIRLTLTRGEKCTSSMNPKFNVYGTTLIVLAEWKATIERATTHDNMRGVTLMTIRERRHTPSTGDSQIDHDNMSTNMLPRIQANLAGAADGIILDMDGYVSETTNIFLVDDCGVLVTPSADNSLPGLTQQTVLDVGGEIGVPTELRRVSLKEFYEAKEVFSITEGELTPVTCIDARTINSGVCGPITQQLQDVYRTLPERPGWASEIPQFL